MPADEVTVCVAPEVGILFERKKSNVMSSTEPIERFNPNRSLASVAVVILNQKSAREPFGGVDVIMDGRSYGTVTVLVTWSGAVGLVATAQIISGPTETPL